jgi:hypothetical protein
VFSKGENSVYLRSITLINPRGAAGKAVNITVVDQVPVSEDEKTRVTDIDQSITWYLVDLMLGISSSRNAAARADTAKLGFVAEADSVKERLIKSGHRPLHEAEVLALIDYAIRSPRRRAPHSPDRSRHQGHRNWPPKSPVRRPAAPSRQHGQ